MARVTVEDCIDKIENRFELVMMASQRTREIGAGSLLTIERDNDKNPVVSLREIADETISIEDLKEALIKRNQRMVAVEDEEEETVDLMDGEEAWANIARDAADLENALEADGVHEATEVSAEAVVAPEATEAPESAPEAEAPATPEADPTIINE